MLLKQGEICTFGCKVLQGCLMSYALDEAGKEHVIQFAPEGWIITDIESVLNKTPSNICIEDCEVIWIEGDSRGIWADASREELLKQIDLFTRNIITANKRVRLLLASTGQERYLDFLETYPTLAQRIPLKLIASYIGVTPEYLSEIRRKLAGK